MPEFDFATLAFILGGISFGLIGVLLAGIALFGEVVCILLALK